MPRLLTFALLCFISVGASADDHLEARPGFDPADARPVELDPVLHFEVLNKALLGGAPSSLPLRVSFDRLTDFDATLMAKLNEAEILLNKLFASREFFNAVLEHKYSSQKTFVQNQGYTNEQIYDLLHLGKETLSPVADGLMNLELKAYYEDSDTVGYTFTQSKTIYVNRKFYNRYTPAQIARNLMHEWLHKVGFSHDVAATARRPYSVPYGMGKIAETVGRNLVSKH